MLTINQTKHKTSHQIFEIRNLFIATKQTDQNKQSEKLIVEFYDSFPIGAEAKYALSLFTISIMKAIKWSDLCSRNIRWTQMWQLLRLDNCNVIGMQQPALLPQTPTFTTLHNIFCMMLNETFLNQDAYLDKIKLYLSIYPS